MKRKQFKPEEIIGLLRQVEVEMAQGKRAGEVCCGLGISERRACHTIGQTRSTQRKALMDAKDFTIRCRCLPSG